jgi:uncharacterized protein YndB with AHSA1/START domain
MKTWLVALLWIGGGLVALVAVVAIIGAALPKEHVASRSMVYKQPPEVVFGVITDFGNYGAWRKDVERVEMLEPSSGMPRFREVGSNGVIAMEVVEMQAPRRLVVRIADPELPFGGRWVYELEAAAEGTRLKITEEGEVYNPIFRFVSKYVMGHTSGIEQYLRALGEKFGEQVAIE